MLQNRNNKLNRKYFLKHKLEIQNLFEKGMRFSNAPIKIVYLVKENNNHIGIKLFLSVPKKQINKACDRNLIKRRIKESIRLNLSELKQLCTDKKIEIHIGFVYYSNKIEDYNIIDNKIVLSLQNIYSNLLNL
ncbi:MAG: ribonuclease P protein component [Bacteroidales bacterium]|nr:ribonuclease P protein component [Bacteroidales bacterium]MDD4216643.1 ribonuclease P protein component [Bacteroidales bacterium]MDY0141760.1 ribonuclease P protein component [Bacteroidales bacterium]